MDSLYERLEVSPNASGNEIRKSYLRLSLKLHPDKTEKIEDHCRFKRVLHAYEVLRDSVLRKEYDIKARAYARSPLDIQLNVP